MACLGKLQKEEGKGTSRAGALLSDPEELLELGCEWSFEAYGVGTTSNQQCRLPQ